MQCRFSHPPPCEDMAAFFLTCGIYLLVSVLIKSQELETFLSLYEVQIPDEILEGLPVPQSVPFTGEAIEVTNSTKIRLRPPTERIQNRPLPGGLHHGYDFDARAICAGVLVGQIRPRNMQTTA